MAFDIQVLSAEEFGDVLKVSVELLEDGVPLRTYNFNFPAEFDNAEVRALIRQGIRADFPAKTGNRSSLLGAVT